MFTSFAIRNNFSRLTLILALNLILPIWKYKQVKITPYN
jgi:hypothetical protein